MPTKTSVALNRLLAQGLLLSLVSGLLVGCEVLNRDLFSQNSTDASPTNASPTDASPASPQSNTAASPPVNASSQTAGKDVACDAPNHFAEVTWQDGGPSMTFAQKPDETSLSQATPVAIVSNADGSTTYGHEGGELTAYVRIYPNGSCLVQALDRQGAVTVEEFGRVGFLQ